MEFTQLIAQRYSCKNFGAGRVDAAALHTILEAGRLAPTAKNTQEQRIYVVQSEEGLAKIDAVPLPAATVPPFVWWSPMTRTTPLLTPAVG